MSASPPGLVWLTPAAQHWPPSGPCCLTVESAVRLVLTQESGAEMATTTLLIGNLEWIRWGSVPPTWYITLGMGLLCF